MTIKWFFALLRKKILETKVLNFDNWISFCLLSNGQCLLKCGIEKILVHFLKYFTIKKWIVSVRVRKIPYLRILDKKIETYADFDSIYFIPMIMVFLLMKFWNSNLPTKNLVFSTIFTSMHLQSSIWNPKENKTSTFDSVL